MDKALQRIMGSSETACPHCGMIFLKPQFHSIIPYRKVLHSFPGTIMTKENFGPKVRLNPPSTLLFTCSSCTMHSSIIGLFHCFKWVSKPLYLLFPFLELFSYFPSSVFAIIHPSDLIQDTTLSQKLFLDPHVCLN